MIQAGYRTLAIKFHPDLAGGDGRTMQELNRLMDKLEARGAGSMKGLFVPVPIELLSLLPPRLALLYGRLVLYAGKDSRCHPKHSTLARDLRVDRVTIYRDLLRLKDLGLIVWKRGRYTNQYEIKIPDVAALQRQMLQGRNISDVTQGRNTEKDHHQQEPLKRSPSPTPPPSPAEKPGAGTGTPKAKAKVFVDDDEPKPKLRLSPEAEFSASGWLLAMGRASTPTPASRT